jgi:DNA-binding winged helix-turn-helix (wHTH) protein
MSIKYIIDGSVLFDSEERTLTPLDQPDHSITLNTPASRCLLLLIEHAGTVVSQKEFFSQIWEQNGAYVTANTFYQNITIVRKGLKSVGLSSDIIKTVPKEGVKLVADIEIFTPEEVVLAASDVLADEPFVADAPLAESPEPVLPTTTVQSAYHEEALASGIGPSVTPAEVGDKQTAASRGSAVTKRLTSARRLNLWLPFGGVIFVFCLLAGYTYNQLNYGKHFFSEYNKIGEVNGCLLFSSYFGREKSTEEFINFFRNGKISCSAGGVAYLTINRHNSTSSILVCDKGIEDKNARCISNLYRVDE